MKTAFVTAAMAAFLLAAGNASADVIIDDFTAGTNFNLVNPANQTVNFVGAGPIGGTRQVVVSSVFGNNTTTLNTAAGTLSVSTTGFSDTFVRYGTWAVPANPELNLALAITESMEVVFSAFSFGSGGDAGGGNDGVVLQLIDGLGQYVSLFVSGAPLQTLATNNGGTLSVALSSFINAGLYNGQIDGIQFGIDDREIIATVSELRFTGGPVQVPEPGTVALLGLGLAGLGFGRRRTRKQAA